MNQMQPIRILTNVTCPHCGKESFAGVAILGPGVEFVVTQDQLDKSRERVLDCMRASAAEEPIKKQFIELWSNPANIVSPVMADQMIAEIRATFGDKITTKQDATPQPEPIQLPKPRRRKA